MSNHFAKIARAAPLFTQLTLPVGRKVDFAPRVAYGFQVRRETRLGWQTAKVTRNRAVAERVFLNMLQDGDRVRLRGPR